jgi:hypothetical protein
MKGWRPSAYPLARNRIRLGEAGEFLPDIGSIGLSFFRKSSGFWSVDAGFPFSRSSGSAAAESDKRRPSVRDYYGASPSLAQTPGGTENEDRR